MRDEGRFNKDLTVVYQQPLSSTNVVVPVEYIARREEPESSMLAYLIVGDGADKKWRERPKGLLTRLEFWAIEKSRAKSKKSGRMEDSAVHD